MGYLNSKNRNNFFFVLISNLNQIFARQITNLFKSINLHFYFLVFYVLAQPCIKLFKCI
jgi:hypothetical protein